MTYSKGRREIEPDGRLSDVEANVWDRMAADLK